MPPARLPIILAYFFADDNFFRGLSENYPSSPRKTPFSENFPKNYLKTIDITTRND